MTDKPIPMKIGGVGTNKIDIEVLDQGMRDRLIECVRKNGKISIMVGHGAVAKDSNGGFAQSVD